MNNTSVFSGRRRRSTIWMPLPVRRPIHVGAWGMGDGRLNGVSGVISMPAAHGGDVGEDIGTVKVIVIGYDLYTRRGSDEKAGRADELDLGGTGLQVDALKRRMME